MMAEDIKPDFPTPSNGDGSSLASPEDGMAVEENDYSAMVERVCEALIFASDEPITTARILAVTGEVSGINDLPQSKVHEAVDRLNESYEREDRMFRIHRWAGGFRMATVPSMEPYLRTLFQETRKKRLSQSLMETLAVVAYRQPATKPEIEYVRGVGSDYALRRLMELGLVDVVGRGETVGRPLLYGTTTGFLEQFGINQLSDLPNLREVEELLQDPAFKRERARLIMEHGLVQHVDSSEASEQ